MEFKEVLPLKEFEAFSVSLPSSKSLTQRALICSALAEGESEIINPLMSEDPLLLKKALLTTGVDFKEDKKGGVERVKGIKGNPYLKGERVYLGNNGTGARFFLAYTTLGEGDWIELYGKPRLHQRPMEPLITTLRTLSAKIECLEREGYFPLRIYPSQLSSVMVSLPGNISSQFISALLLIAPYLPSGLEITIKGEIFSKGYIEATLEVMEKFGVKAERKDNHFYVAPSWYKGIRYEVPADASSASYFLAIPLVLGKGKINIENFDPRSLQADNVFLEFIQSMGAQVKIFSPLGVEVSFEGRPKGGVFNLKDSPDLFPTMAILGAVAEGKTTLYGAPHLRFKETDRIRAIAKELNKLGVEVEELPDGIVITGTDKFSPSDIHTYDDHRIAMSFAILGLKIGPLRIKDPNCVQKSFSEFWELLERLYGKN